MYRKFAADALANPLPLISGHPLLIPRKPLTPAAIAVTIRNLAARLSLSHIASANLCQTSLKVSGLITITYKPGPHELRPRGRMLFFYLREGAGAELFRVKDHNGMFHSFPTSAKNRRLVYASLAARLHEMSFSSRDLLAYELADFYQREKLYGTAKTEGQAAQGVFERDEV